MMSLGNWEGEEDEDAEPEELPDRSAVLFLRETGRVTFVSCAFLLFWGKEAFFMEALNLSVVPYV